MCFDMAVTVLFRVDLRRIGRQPLHDHLRVLCQVVLHDTAAMNRCSVPEQNPGAANVPPAVFQRDSHPGAINRLGEVALEMRPEIVSPMAVASTRRSLVTSLSTGRCPRTAHVRDSGAKNENPVSS